MPGVGGGNVYAKVGSSWVAAEDVQGRYSGAWAQADEVRVRRNGSWRLVWEYNTAPQPVTGLGIAWVANGYTWNATATWTLPAELDLANVYVRWTIGGTVGAYTQLAANATSHTVAATSGATMSVAVYVIDTGGLSSSVVSYNGGTGPLDAPPTVTLTQTDWDELRADWSHPSGSGRTGYSIAWSGGVTSSSTLSASTTTQTKTVTSGVATTVTVYATNSYGNGRSRSATGTAVNVTPGATSVPTIAVADSSVSPGVKWKVTGSWTLPADTDLANVYVRWSTGSSSTSLTAGSWQALAANATSHTIDPAASATYYKLEVYVRDQGGLNSSTKTSAVVQSRPYVPQGLISEQVGLDSVRLSWTVPAGTLTEQQVRKGTSAGSGTVTTGVSKTATSYTWATAPGTYYLAVVAKSASNVLGHWGEDFAVSMTAPAPGTPTVSSWTYTSVTMTWTHATWHDGGYEIQRATGTGSWATLTTVSSSTTSYTSSSLLNDTNYRWRVRALGANGNAGAWSGELRVAIGHPAYTTTTSYSATNSSCNIYGNSSGTGSTVGADGVNVASNATISSMTLDLAATFSTSLATGWSARSSYYVVGGSVGSLVGTKNNPWQETIAFSQTGGGLAGVLNVGTGWSWTSTGGYRLTGTITVTGTQSNSYPAVSNGYW